MVDFKIVNFILLLFECLQQGDFFKVKQSDVRLLIHLFRDGQIFGLAYYLARLWHSTTHVRDHLTLPVLKKKQREWKY